MLSSRRVFFMLLLLEQSTLRQHDIKNIGILTMARDMPGVNVWAWKVFTAPTMEARWFSACGGVWFCGGDFCCPAIWWKSRSSAGFEVVFFQICRIFRPFHRKSESFDIFFLFSDQNLGVFLGTVEMMVPDPCQEMAQAGKQHQLSRWQQGVELQGYIPSWKHPSFVHESSIYWFLCFFFFPWH